MVVVAQGNNWWIESFTIARAALTDNNLLITVLTLGRAGIFLGGSSTLDHSDSNMGGVSTAIRNTDNSVLAIGDSLTDFDCVISNNAGSTKTMGAQVFMLLRTP